MGKKASSQYQQDLITIFAYPGSYSISILD